MAKSQPRGEAVPAEHAQAEPEGKADSPREADPAGVDEPERDWRAAFTRERESHKKIRSEAEDLRARLAKSEADFEELRERSDSARLLAELAKRGQVLSKPDQYLAVVRSAIEKAHPGVDYARVPDLFFERFREEHSALFSSGPAKSGSGAGAGGGSARELADRLLLPR